MLRAKIWWLWNECRPLGSHLHNWLDYRRWLMHQVSQTMTSRNIVTIMVARLYSKVSRCTLVISRAVVRPTSLIWARYWQREIMWSILNAIHHLLSLTMTTSTKPSHKFRRIRISRARLAFMTQTQGLLRESCKVLLNQFYNRKL